LKRGVTYILFFITAFFCLLGYYRHEFEITSFEGKITDKYLEVKAYDVISNIEERTNYFITVAPRGVVEVNAIQYNQLSKGDKIRIHKTNYGTVTENVSGK
jgi:hypothetical protein